MPEKKDIQRKTIRPKKKPKLCLSDKCIGIDLTGHLEVKWIILQGHSISVRSLNQKRTDKQKVRSSNVNDPRKR